MSDYYGYTRRAWETGRDEMYRILERIASQQKTISYGDLSGALRTISIGPHESSMAAMLGEISEQEDACGRGMLSAVVIHKGDDSRPGQGFFKYAAQLGRDISDPDSMWVAELKRVHDAWKKSN